MISFSSIGHFFASAFHDLHVAAVAVAKVETATAKLEPTIEGITSLVYPPGVAVERIAFALLGEVAAVVTKTDSAVAAKGVNVALDAEMIAEVKQLLAQFKGDLVSFGIKV
jgi:hypothetical protein